MKFCKQCGNQLFDEAVICPACHSSAIQSYKIRIQSTNQFVIGKIVYDIIVDGVETQSIRAGESMELELQEGQHNLKVNYKFRSKSITIDLRRDVNLKVEWDRFTGGVSIFEI